MDSPYGALTYWSERGVNGGEHRFEIPSFDSSMPPPGATYALDNNLYKLSRRLQSFRTQHIPLITLVLILRVSAQGDERPEDEVMHRICQLPNCCAALKIDSAIGHTRTRASENLPSTITMQQQLTSYYKQYSRTRSLFRHVFSGKTITYYRSRAGALRRRGPAPPMRALAPGY